MGGLTVACLTVVQQMADKKQTNYVVADVNKFNMKLNDCVLQVAADDSEFISNGAKLLGFSGVS